MSILKVDENYKKAVKEVSFINSGKNKKVYILTLGCQQNVADSEKILGMARAMGYTETKIPEEADLAFVNTCAVREHAELRAMSFIGKFKAVKEQNPNLILGVCGCMAAEEHMTEKLKRSFPYVSFTVEPNKLDMIPELVYKYMNTQKRTFVRGMDIGDVVEGMPVERTSAHTALVSIMYGCNNFCSYCIVPYTRGRERSRASQDILAECRALVKDGVKEITLLGQNVNSYKSDTDFAGLIEQIALIEGDFIIRFMTSHPKDVSDKLIAVMAKYTGKIAPHFHLPLQSGSDRVLEVMNRTYNSKKFLEVAGKIKSAVPNIALTSDIIVGFPGESDGDFEDTLTVLREVEFDMVYSFIYSKRCGTPAASIEGQVSEEDKKKRMQALLDLQDEISLKKNMPYVDGNYRVLVDGKDGETLKGRTPSGKLVIIKNAENAEKYIGEFVNVKVTGAAPFNLFCEIVN